LRQGGGCIEANAKSKKNMYKKIALQINIFNDLLFALCDYVKGDVHPLVHML